MARQPSLAGLRISFYKAEIPLRAKSKKSFVNSNSRTSLKHMMRRGVIRVGHFLFFARNALFPLVFLSLLFTTQPEFPFGSERGDQWLDFAGFLVILAGQSCRALAIGQTENIRRGGRRKQVAAKRLIQHGIYAHTRNPLYLGNLLIVVGLGLIANNHWWYIFVFPLFLSVYWSIVLAEEEFLLRQFGAEYEQYRQQVNRFLPRLRGLRQSCRECDFDWMRVLRKEYGIACSWLSMLVGLLIWERWKLFGFDERELQIQMLTMGLVVILILYVSLWRLKLAGKFQSRTHMLNLAERES
jgi:protein-S-isoprenylcysteine O-methyltransferase Ste14